MKKILSIPVEEFSLSKFSEDDRIVKLSMKILHDGINLNKSSISLQTIYNAVDTSLSNSITGIPILAAFNDDLSDFKEHNDDEISIGLIPPTNNNVSYIKDDDNEKTYMHIDGYIWRYYSKTSVDILEEAENNEKACSIEIEVTKGHKDRKSNVYIIEAFKFLGVTLLGSGYAPGMEKAGVKLDYSEENSKYIERIKKLSDELNMVFTKKSDGTVSPITKINNALENIKENNITEKEDDLMFNKTEFAQKFNLTVSQMFDELYKVVCKQDTFATDWGYTMCRYCMRDFDDAFCYVVDYKEDKLFRVPYSMEGDNPSLDFEKSERVKTQYVLWESNNPESDDVDDLTEEFIIKEKEEIKTAVTSEKEKFGAEIEKINSEHSSELEKLNLEFASTLNSKESELKSLLEFKENVLRAEFQSKVNSLYEKYAEFVTDEEKTEFNNKLSTFDSFESFEKEFKLTIVPKMEAKMYALQNASNGGKQDETNKINISVMGLVSNIENKNKENKSSFDLLKEYVES